MTHRHPWYHRHSLSLVAVGILAGWIVMYTRSSPDTHLGAFFGNAIADWSGLVVMVLATKHLYERGSAESRQPRGILPNAVEEFVRDHSLTIFLLLTGAVWIWAYVHMDVNSKWGQVVGNIVSEWTQTLGLVLMTKRLFEVGSKDSRH
ncbi:MAG: hypothetical protein ACR2IF_03515 [Terriglobales bacterium]